LDEYPSLFEMTDASALLLNARNAHVLKYAPLAVRFAPSITYPSFKTGFGITRPPFIQNSL
jgi:hypothetical protein